MAQTIWKFWLSGAVGEPLVVPMPLGAEILAVQSQQGNAVVWALCDPAAPIEPRYFRVFPTGVTPREDFNQHKYIGSVQELEGALVWHVFEQVLFELGR